MHELRPARVYEFTTSGTSTSEDKKKPLVAAETVSMICNVPRLSKRLSHSVLKAI